MDNAHTEEEKSATGSTQDLQKQRPIEKDWADLTDVLATYKNGEEREKRRDQILLLADNIWVLVEEKRDNHGQLPSKRLKYAALELGLSEDQIHRLMARMKRHDEQRKKGLNVGPRANAVILKKPGRRKGSFAVPLNVQELILDAWQNPDWEALNHVASTDAIHHPLNRTMVYNFVKVKYPHLKISYATVGRVINAFEKNRMAESHWAHDKQGAVRDHLLALDVDFGDPNEYWILDVRPLPIRSRYKSLVCTVGLLMLMDAASSNVLRHKILPRQEEDDQGTAFGIDFTCRHIREEIAMAITEWKICPRIIYVDNASIFQALQKFLDLLTPEGEEPTELVFSGPGEPRGRGIMERGLGLVNQFIQYKPGFFEEDNYRTSLANKKKYKNYEFSFLEKEFAHFFPIRNTQQGRNEKHQLSLEQRYKQNTNKGLRPPSGLQIALFGGTISPGSYTPNRKGLNIQNTFYVPESESPEVGVLMANVALAKKKVDVLIADIGDLKNIYVKLNGKEWELFIEATKRRWSAMKRKEWNDSVRQKLNAGAKTAREHL